MKYGRAIRILLGSFCILLAAGADAPAQDKSRWEKALKHFKMMMSVGTRSQRAAAIEGLGNTTFDDVDAKTAKWITQALATEFTRSGKERLEELVFEEVLDECTAALRKLKNPKAIQFLLKSLKKGKDPRYAYYVVLALAGSAAGDHHEKLVELVGSKDDMTALAAIEALAIEGKEESFETFCTVLETASVRFEKKTAAVQGIGRLLNAANRKQVDRLVEAAARIPAVHQRVQAEVRDLLNIELGMRLETLDVKRWKAEIEADRKGEAPPAAGKEGKPAHRYIVDFFGIRSDSTRVIFVLDRTGSMLESFSAPRMRDLPMYEEDKSLSRKQESLRTEAWLTKKRYEDRELKTRMDAVRRAFLRAAYGLSPNVSFTVVWYSAEADAWSSVLVPATWQNKLLAMKHAEEIEPYGTTNIWSGIELALSIRGEGDRPVSGRKAPRGGNPARLPPEGRGADTIYVLTDGAHNVGKFVKEGTPAGPGTPGTPTTCDTNAFLSELKKINRVRKIVFHTICVGDYGSAYDPPDPTFLRALSSTHGGEFVHIMSGR
ncbi:MAG: vWA domain-containing protein [Planctomycetota bacterium]|jgi:hypothetical protein